KGDSAEAVANFASELFGERFGPDSICTEKYLTLPGQKARYLPASPTIEGAHLQRLRDLSKLDVVYDFCMDHIAPPELLLEAMDSVAKDVPEAPAEFLGKVLSENILFRTIEDCLVLPRSLEEVTQHLLQSVRTGADETYLQREVEAYLLLGAKAKIGGQPL